LKLIFLIVIRVVSVLGLAGGSGVKDAESLCCANQPLWPSATISAIRF